MREMAKVQAFIAKDAAEKKQLIAKKYLQKNQQQKVVNKMKLEIKNWQSRYLKLKHLFKAEP